MAAKRFNISTGTPGVNLQYKPKAASTAFSGQGLVTYDSDGNITPATSDSTFVIGIGLQKVTSSDDDYADTSLKAIDEARPSDRFIMDIDSATGVDRGDELGLDDAETVNSAALAAGENALVVIDEVLQDDQVVVTLKTHQPTEVGT
jgi:hypothetical protein